MKKLTIKGDKVIWLITIIFSIASLLIIYSSTVSLSYQKNTSSEMLLFKQIIIMVFGLGLLYIAHHIHFIYYSRIGQLLMILSIPLLLATLFIAPSINDATRSIYVNLPITGSLSFQPSDIAKLAMMMFIARFLAKNNQRELTFKQFMLKIGLLLIIVTFLILRSNLSTAAILFMVSILVLLLGNAYWKNILKLLGIALLGFSSLLIVGKFVPEVFPRLETWTNRIESFFDKTKESEPNEQILRSKIAIAQGGLLGKMPGKSTQRNFLPLAYNDYVFAIIVEEYGLIGGFMIIMLFMILLFRSIKIARKCKVPFGSYLVIGISLLLVIQALINMAVAVDIVPITGQPLPFLSMGGTSFWFSCFGIGIILSVSHSIENDEENSINETDYVTT